MKDSLSGVNLDRRTALAALGAAGLGLLGEPMSIDGTRPGDGAQDATLQGFNEKSRERLQHLLRGPDFSGQIPASEVEWLADSEHKQAPGLMVDLLPLARTYARPPISHYNVGAVARGASGALYLGANIEFPGQALGFSVHAEQSALSNAYMHNESAIAAIAVTAAPCGHCRQFMTEFSPEGSIDVIIPDKPLVRLSALLPSAFGPKDLGLAHGALPVSAVDLAVTGASDDVVSAARGAARRSWAPYSKSPSGVALQAKSGRIFAGSYIENVAFNPSLPPFETALAALILSNENATDITRALLVELKGASISQRRYAEAALNAVAPAVQLEVSAAVLARR